MKDLAQDSTEAAAPRRADKKAITVSARKIAANRQNALKSTGPKTLRGKAYSGKNATKHGLFARHVVDFVAHDEDPEEYNELLRRLHDQYQPVGVAEELEVEYITVCWWKRHRAWRFENGMNRYAIRAFAREERLEQAEDCGKQDEKDKACILLLERAKKEIESFGELSEETKQSIFKAGPHLEPAWARLEEDHRESLNDPVFRDLNSEDRSALASWHCVKALLAGIKDVGDWVSATVRELSIAPHILPDGRALDKLLRFGAANDRQLNRAIDRLERLQRRRQGEMIPPPVSVHLTR